MSVVKITSPKLEADIEQLDALMQDPEKASDAEFVKKYQAVNSSLEKEMESWEVLQQELEEAEEQNECWIKFKQVGKT